MMPTNTPVMAVMTRKQHHQMEVTQVAEVEEMDTKIQLPPVNPLNKLYCSLMSGLRNEIDFGLRVSTILANSKESSWISDFKFIDILIDCIESYSCCCDEESSVKQVDNGRVFCNIRVKDEDSNNQHKPCTCLQRFWSGLYEDKRVMNLVYGSSSDGDTLMKSSEDDEDTYDSDDEDLAYLMNTKKHEPKIHQRIYNLIKNITEIIRNLSFNIADSTIPSAHDESGTSGYSYNFVTLNLMKFLVLLISCKDQYYINLGLDIISNISSHLAINSVNSQYLTFLELINRYCINAIISSNDIHQINRSLEIITKIISRYSDDPNEYIAIQSLDNELLQRLTELLTCQHDVGIVISSLELLFILSESYSKLLVEESKYLIKILVMLLNCEASSFFTKNALARIKIVDERPKQIELSNKTPNLKTTTTTTFVTPTNDNESYAVNWLRTFFEAKPNPGTLLRLNEIYEDYVKECIRCERKNVISAHNFAILTKRCFPSITMTGPIIDGLTRRPVTVTTTTTTTKGPGGLSSPILKAQLCAPPKAGSVSPGPGAVVSTPPNTSTLIKNLLANKLRTNNSLGSPSSTTISISSITTGSVTVTPASASSPSSSNKDNGNGSKSDTTTTIIPCTINNLNSTFTQPQKPQEPYPDPADLTPSANKTAFSNSSQSHKSKDSKDCTASTSVITSITTSHVSTSSTSSTSTPSPATSLNNIFVSNTSNSTSSLSTSVTITPAITNPAPLIPAVSSGSTNTQQVIVTATSTANILQPQTTCITTGQALQGGSVLITTPAPQPGQPLQPNQPQQFLLVRTIVGNQQQTGLVGMPAGVASGTPVRLILPPGFLTQQRPVQQPNATINGVTTVPVAITSSQDSITRNAIPNVLTNSTKVPLAVSTSQTFVTSQPISSVSTVTTASSSTSPQAANSNSNDILLKAVLGSGIVSDNPPASANATSNATSNRSNTVKSSPLLNVLLDKGKLPDFSAMAGTVNMSNVTSSCVTTITSVTTSSPTSPFNNPPTSNTIVSSASTPITNMSGSQSNKVYILTTKSSLPIKNVSNVQQSTQPPQVNSTVATNNLQKSITVQQVNPTQTVQQQLATNVIHQPPVMTQSVINSPENNLNSSTSVSVATPTLNRLVSSTTESSTFTQNTSITTTVKTIQVDSLEPKSTLTTIKSELSNGEVSPNLVHDDDQSTYKTPNEIIMINDVNNLNESSASKMISKRSHEDDEDIKPQTKKMKSNNSIKSLSITPVKKEIKVESQQLTNKIKTNGTSVINSSNGQKGKESSSSTSSAEPSTVSSSQQNKPTSDSATNTSPPTSVNGTPSTNTSTTAQPATVKSKSAIKPTSVNHKNLQFYCEWHECKKVFNRASQVYWHVHKEHVNIYGNTSEKMTCKWGGPEGRGPGCLSSRPKLSLLTHMNDFHCNATALQQSALRRESGVNAPPPIVPPAHPGYSSNAALLAIRRHAINYVELPKPSPITPLTPITTSIRLTSALILRNLAQVSPKLRSFLQSLEPYLSELCIVEGREESRTIAQCLGVITERK